MESTNHVPSPGDPHYPGCPDLATCPHCGAPKAMPVQPVYPAVPIYPQPWWQAPITWTPPQPGFVWTTNTTWIA